MFDFIFWETKIGSICVNWFSVWPSRVYGSIETIKYGTMLLKQFKLFVLVQDLFLLVGGMLNLFIILSLSISLLRTTWSGLNQVPTDLNVMLMRPFLKLGIGLALVCAFEMMKVVMFWPRLNGCLRSLIWIWVRL